MDLKEALQQASALLRANRLLEAESVYLEVLAVEPRNLPALHFLGILRARQGRRAEALALIEAALKGEFDAGILSNYASVLSALGWSVDALQNYDRALEIAPQDQNALYNRALILLDLKRFEEALETFDALLVTRPEDAEVFYNRGIALLNLMRFEEAVASFDKAVMVKPYFAEALTFRGTALSALGRYKEALASYDSALDVNPDFPDALYHRGYLQWFKLGSLPPALRDMERAAALDPNYNYIMGDLLHLRMHAGDWHDFDKLLGLINAGVRAGKRVILPFNYQGISESPADLQTCSVIYSNHFYPARGSAKAKKRGGAKIRLGYVCGDFGEHPTGYLTAGLFECHDRSKFELIAFDNGVSDGSPLRARLEATFDRFQPIAKLSNAAAAALIADNGVNILVNLNGYYGDGRTGVFAERPAPIQVNYLGFPGTLGASYFDYLLADRCVIPESERQFYTERVVYLPGTYQATDSKRPISDISLTRAECGLPDGAFIFCNFNQSYKLAPSTFAVWMRILRDAEGSVLWLLESNACFRENIRREAERQGVMAERIIFAPAIAVDRHLARLRLADLFLDTLPYNAHTTASDALWAGLPLITCLGKSFAGRVAASLLHAVGLPELITDNMRDYQSLAIRLACDPALLQSVRKKLAFNRLTFPLFDTARFCRGIEAAYVRMWEIAQSREAPKSFSIAPESDAITGSI